jgi:hypothetical protein
LTFLRLILYTPFKRRSDYLIYDGKENRESELKPNNLAKRRTNIDTGTATAKYNQKRGPVGPKASFILNKLDKKLGGTNTKASIVSRDTFLVSE